jgi:hypothetical protein
MRAESLTRHAWPSHGLACLLIVTGLSFPLAVQAHKGSDAYLTVATQPDGRAELRLSIALKDLDVVLPIDTNQDAEVTWGEVRAAAPAVSEYLAQAMRWRSAGEAAGDCAATWRADGLERRSDGVYWIARTTLACDTPALGLVYQLMAEVDRSHRLLVSGEWRGQPLLATLAPGDPLAIGSSQGSAQGSAQADPVAQSPGATVLNYLETGALHMLEGYDHMAFLLALVLPLCLPLKLPRRHPFAGVHVRPVGSSGRPSDWGRMLATVTAFTVGHSVTLGLVAWGWLQVSSDWVEPAIVVSIGVSALLNIYPVRWLRTEVLAGLFGLVHGMGFAGLLLDANAPLSLLPWALLGFNLGIEAAQLLVFLLWVLVCQPMLSAPWYQTRVVRGLSWALVAFSLALLLWFVGWY